MLKSILEYTTGASLLVLGILFLIYLSDNATNVASDVIFLGGGFLIVQRTYRNSKKAKLERKPERNNLRKERQKLNTRKRS